jgi:CDP-glucose 4,6-dehydratase
VLLTGHTGFKGTWLAVLLDRLGAQLTGLSLAPESDLALWPAVAHRIRVHEHLVDLRERGAVADVIDDARPQIVLHLAAQALVRRSYSDPPATYSTNVMGTVNLLDALKSRIGLEAVLVVTSDKVYENNEGQHAFAEDERLGGSDPYSASKAACELIVKSYRDCFFAPAGVPVATARAGNVIGGGDWAKDRLIPDIVRARIRGEVVRLRNPGARRPWQHVLDCLSGYLRFVEHIAAQKVAEPDSLNFGPLTNDAPLTVSDLTGEFLRRLDPGTTHALDIDNHSPPEKNSLILNSHKAQQTIGWMPRMDIRMAIERTVAWYASFLQGADAYLLVKEQVDDYLRPLPDQLGSR